MNGIAHPNFKNGKFSKVLKGLQLGEDLQEALQDPDLLTLRQEAALLDVRMKQLLEAFETGETGKLWLKLRGMAMYLQELLAEGDQEGRDQLLRKMVDVIERGASEYLTWQSIVSMIGTRRQVVESERKRLVDLQQYLTKEQGMLMVSVIIESIRKHVTDADTRQAIQDDIFEAVERNRPDVVAGPYAGSWAGDPQP